jgi:hypothetical protein
MATFTRDWSEASPTDSDYAYDLDNYMRELRVDTSDRLKDMVYGFTAGENDGKMGFKELTFKQQVAASGTPNADEFVLYSIDDGTACGLYAKQEDGYAKQLLKKSGTNLILSLDDNDNVVLKTTAQTITGDKTFSGVNIFSTAITIADASLLASSAAPTTDAMIANKKYVDDQIDTQNITPTTYAGEESITFANGLILKHGQATFSTTTATITFGTAFPTAIISVIGTPTDTLVTVLDTDYIAITASSVSAVTFKLRNGNFEKVYWQAWGY